MNTVFFSVIVPVFNRASEISKTLLSILNQTYSAFELIVVDDGSTDNTAQQVKELIKQRPDVNFRYFYRENAERGAARNFGASKASGGFLNFFDSDDLMYPMHLEEAARLIASETGLLWFHLNYDRMDETGRIFGKGPGRCSDPNRSLIRGNHLSCNGVFLNRTCFQSLSFREDRALAGMEDWELWLRWAAKYPLGMRETRTSAIVYHKQRSVLEKDPAKLLNRVNLLIGLIEENKDLRSFMGTDLDAFRSSCYSYASLHLALMKGQKRESANYLIKSVLQQPSGILSRRFLAILRHWI
ncbi:MAG TPA: glycosyltransferase [Bacteroidia bacterium]|nr:glycosyltransferase [Bacteroidia bacterium]